MVSSGTTTIGSLLILGDADNDVVLAGDADSTGLGVICQQGTLSEAVVSFGCGAASSTTPDKDAGIAV